MAESNRSAFNATLDVRQQYLTMAFMKIPGQADWTLLDQAKIATPAATAEEKTYNRIGDKNTKKLGGQVSTAVTLQIYVEDSIEEVALALGVPRPGSGWVGTENIELDPTKVIDIKLVSYDGYDAGASPLFSEFINEFSPFNFSIPEDADGDARIAELSGNAVAYYIIPEAGT